MRSLPVRVFLLACVVLVVGCGGGGASRVRNEPAHSGAGQQQYRSPQRGRAQQAPVGSGRSISDAVRLCHDNGGPGRNDYSYIASYRCSDGSMPLDGDAVRGARARLGSIGAGPDGHIVDLYEIPCATGPVRVHVDAYHCGASVDTTLDTGRFTRSQLANLAQSIRALHGDPSSADAMEMRRELLMWLMETQQVTVVVCGGLSPLLPMNDAQHPYLPELMLSMAAAVIEDGRDPADPVGVHVASIQGLLVYYQAVLAAEGPGARDPQLDALLAMAQDGTLPSAMARATAGCDLSGLGVHFVR